MRFETLPWADAIGEAEETGNRQPLLALLRADAPMTAEARKLLADHLESGLDWSLLTERQRLLVEVARDYLEHENDRKGESPDEALARLAREHGLRPIGNAKKSDQHDGAALRNLLKKSGDASKKLRPYLNHLMRPLR